MEDQKISRKARFTSLMQTAAAKALVAEDPWAKYDITSVPAERVIRHLYNTESQTWWTDETIVKMEKYSFTHGAMRHCYRMKKRAAPPKEATNHRFHKVGWSTALNYVAKAYQKDGVVDTSDEAKKAVQNDIALQFEAQKWAAKFNENDPPSKIHFIRAYAVEFPDREGKPWFAVERFIAGTDRYGSGFVKHNTNAGFVDTELHRVTPQLFSAHSFYASEGTRLVADIQGVGDLYTDPQVLSSDYRFGDGDLGPRGMALFFKTFRHTANSDALGIPIFPLSKNELRHQAKYEEDEATVSEDDDSQTDDSINGEERLDRFRQQLDKFQRLDRNRFRRSIALKTPKELAVFSDKDTVRRSNMAPRGARERREDMSSSMRASMRVFRPKPQLHRTKSDVDDIALCLERARKDFHFTLHDFHRHASGDLKERHYKESARGTDTGTERRKSSYIRSVSAPMIPNAHTKENLGRVHYQLAVLHGIGRFPEVVHSNAGEKPEDVPSHDSFSVLFHLSYAAALQNVPACLALARVHAGLGTHVSDLLPTFVSTDFEAAKDLLRRAMESPQLPTHPKAAAGCLLFQILNDERNVRGSYAVPDTVLIQALKDSIGMMETAEAEKSSAANHKDRTRKLVVVFHLGDRVEANYCLEGSFYPGLVTNVSNDDDRVTVRYDDDGSEEDLDADQVRLLVPPTATQTNLGGPLSDDEAFGAGNEGDENWLFKRYELQAELAALQEELDRALACELYQAAAEGAAADGKMKNASAWSLKAGELEE